MKSKFLGLFDTGRKKDASSGRAAASHREEALAGAVTDGSPVQILTEANAQKVEIELLGARGLEDDVLAYCLPIRVDKRELLLEIAQNDAPIKELRGTCVTCLFTLRQGRKYLFCRFTSTIDDIEFTKLGMKKARLSMPERIETRERAAFRFTPMPEQVTGLEMWAAKMLQSGQQNDPAQWGAPVLMSPDDGYGLEVGDISAGGMRFRFPVRVEMPVGVAFVPGRKFFIRLGLEEVKDDRVLLFGVVRSAGLSLGGQNRDVGMQFVGVGLEDAAGNVSWRKVGEEGVPHLGDWVVRRHLQMCRMRSG